MGIGGYRGVCEGGVLAQQGALVKVGRLDGSQEEVGPSVPL